MNDWRLNAVIFVSLVVIHEIGHALYAIMVLKKRPTIIALGIPISISIPTWKGRFPLYYSVKISNWPVLALSPILIGGGGWV